MWGKISTCESSLRQKFATLNGLLKTNLTVKTLKFAH